MIVDTVGRICRGAVRAADSPLVAAVTSVDYLFYIPPSVKFSTNEH